jgi:hypothetical protein
VKPSLVAATVLALAASCGGGGGGASDAPSLLGTVTALTAACPSGAGGLPSSTCRLLSISGGGNATLEVELRIAEANPAVPFLGTVVLGSGGEGTSFYGDFPGAIDLLVGLQDLGFRVVDRRWQTGWFTTDEDPRRQSSRYAALLQWVHDNVHTTGAFVATGNSGGAGEIAYALTTWGAGDLLDVAVLSGGPPLSRLDWLCGDPPSPEWAATCASIVPPGELTCGTTVCTPDAGITLCGFLPASPAAGELEESSILHADAELSFPDTALHGLFGAEDCTNAVPLGLLFFDSVTSAKTVAFVSGAPHQMPATLEGRRAILTAIEDGVLGPVPLVVPALQFELTVDEDGGEALLWGRIVEPETNAVVGRIVGVQTD